MNPASHSELGLWPSADSVIFGEINTSLQSALEMTTKNHPLKEKIPSINPVSEKQGLSQVYFHVGQQMAASREVFPTCSAGERLLTCVGSHVSSQITSVCKPFPARFTGVDLTHVDAHVTLQVTFADESLLTGPAIVRPLSRVDSQVVEQIGAMSEALPARSA